MTKILINNEVKQARTQDRKNDKESQTKSPGTKRDEGAMRKESRVTNTKEGKGAYVVDHKRRGNRAVQQVSSTREMYRVGPERHK